MLAAGFNSAPISAPSLALSTLKLRREQGERRESNARAEGLSDSI